jgi:pSer/pThr/pTyr-binding forkhead associated (FHA) protein
MKASLLVTQGAHKGREIPITVSPFVIGRDPQCHLRPTNPVISRRHCALFLQSGKLIARDFGSTNGTLVNDRRIEGEQELHNDDRLRLDTLVLVIRIETGASVEQSGVSPRERSPAEAADEEAVAAVLLELQDDRTPAIAERASRAQEPSLGDTVLQTEGLPPLGNADGLVPLDDSDEE